jgi:micrococcal nuclease
MLTKKLFLLSLIAFLGLTNIPKVALVSAQSKSDGYWHKVVRVVDGDTVVVRINGKDSKIRVIGIDTPESVDPRKTVQCFGKEGTAKAKEFLNGKWVKLESDPSQGDKDKYNRPLRYIWFDNGTDFGRRMIEEGYAHEYTYRTPYSKQTQYKATYKKAQNAQKGLWSQNTCNGKREKPVTSPAPTPAPVPTPQPTPTPSAESSSNVYFANCTAARAAGAAPIYAGQPGYRSALDRDHDGVACE